MLDLNTLSREVHELAVKKGWYDADALQTDAESVMMIVTECAETVEEMRRGRRVFVVNGEGRPEGVLVELADTLIRTLDLMQHVIERDMPNLTIEKVVLAKHDFNKGREHQHGGKRLGS